MLVLLSAPRGRVSAARIVARMREQERTEAHPATSERPPHAPPSEIRLEHRTLMGSGAVS